MPVVYRNRGEPRQGKRTSRRSAGPTPVRAAGNYGRREAQRSSAGNGRARGGAATRIRASTTTAPIGPTPSGLQSSSAISGCAEASAGTRREGRPRPPQRQLARRRGTRRAAGTSATRAASPGRPAARAAPAAPRRHRAARAVPSGAAGDHGSEVRVADDADDQRRAGLGHALDQESLRPVPGYAKLVRHRPRVTRRSAAAAVISTAAAEACATVIGLRRCRRRRAGPPMGGRRGSPRRR
jgi:hypothetical protein